MNRGGEKVPIAPICCCGCCAPGWPPGAPCKPPAASSSAPAARLRPCPYPSSAADPSAAACPAYRTPCCIPGITMPCCIMPCCIMPCCIMRCIIICGCWGNAALPIICCCGNQHLPSSGARRACAPAAANGFMPRRRPRVERVQVHLLRSLVWLTERILPGRIPLGDRRRSHRWFPSQTSIRRPHCRRIRKRGWRDGCRRRGGGGRRRGGGEDGRRGRGGGCTAAGRGVGWAEAGRGPSTNLRGGCRWGSRGRGRHGWGCPPEESPAELPGWSLPPLRRPARRSERTPPWSAESSPAGSQSGGNFVSRNIGQSLGQAVHALQVVALGCGAPVHVQRLHRVHLAHLEEQIDESDDAVVHHPVHLERVREEKLRGPRSQPRYP